MARSKMMAINIERTDRFKIHFGNRLLICVRVK